MGSKKKTGSRARRAGVNELWVNAGKPKRGKWKQAERQSPTRLGLESKDTLAVAGCIRRGRKSAPPLQAAVLWDNDAQGEFMGQRETVK